MQINLGKSRDAQLKMINQKNLLNDYDIIMIQEPYISPAQIDHILTHSNFRPVLPDTSKDKKKVTVRSVIWVSTNLNTAQWEPLGQTESNNLTAIHLKIEGHQITLFNIYNDCTNNDSLTALDGYLK